MMILPLNSLESAQDIGRHRERTLVTVVDIKKVRRIAKANAGTICLKSLRRKI